MEDARPKRKKWIWILAGTAAALLVLGAVLYLLGSAGSSARFDSAAEILADYDPSAFGTVTVGEGGAVSARMNRRDLYYLASRYGLLDDVRDGIRERAGRAEVGFRISDGQVMVYSRSRALGILRLAFRADMEPVFSGETLELVLRPRRVYLGGHIPLPESMWPALFDRDVRLSLEKFGDGITGIRTEGDSAVIELEGLSRFFTGELTADRDLLDAAALFNSENAPGDGMFAFVSGLDGDEIPVQEALERVTAADDPGAALAELMACCTEDSVILLWRGVDVLTRDVLGRQMRAASAARRDALETAVAAEQSKYEKLLSSVREMYRSGSLVIAENSFLNAATGETVDPGALSRLSATATDCRIVLLYSPAGSPDISTHDVPPLAEIPRADRRAMETLDPDTDYDVGVVLTSEGGVPVLLCRREDGCFTVREISETLYVDALVSRSNPVLNADALEPPAREILRSSGEGWNGCAILLLFH